MTAKDKDYIDRLYNMLCTDITSLQDRIIALEGKPDASPEDSITVELDKNQMQTIINDCLHDYKLVNGNELQCLIDIYNDAVPALNENLKSTDKRFELIRIALIKLLGINHNESKPNAAQDATIAHRIHVYLTGHFSLPRGYTLLTLILYVVLLFLITFFHVSISIT